MNNDNLITPQLREPNSERSYISERRGFSRQDKLRQTRRFESNEMKLQTFHFLSMGLYR